MDTAFLLGAGFSKAISQSMPLMAELASVSLDAIQSHHLPKTSIDPSKDIEAWLSYLLEDQPFLSEEENLRNHAAGLVARSAVGEHVVRKQHEARTEGIPNWLDDLVTLWHGRRSPVLTLNWDTLIEDAVESLKLWSLSHLAGLGEQPITCDDILYHNPRLAPGSLEVGRPGRTSFRLWKLHGSVDWYWSEGDPFGETVVRRPFSRPPFLGDNIGIAGKSPFLIAPTASKAIWYRNMFLKNIWRSSKEALGRASEIVVIGYSVPVSDLSISALLGAAGGSRIVLVDPNAEEVETRIRRFLHTEAQVEQFSDVADYVASQMTEFMRELGGRLVGGDTHLPMVVRLGDGYAGPVTGFVVKGESVELRAGAWLDSLDAATGINAPAAISTRELLEAGLEGVPVFISGPDEVPPMMYNVSRLNREVGQHPAWWLIDAQAAA